MTMIHVQFVSGRKVVFNYVYEFYLAGDTRSYLLIRQCKQGETKSHRVILANVEYYSVVSDEDFAGMEPEPIELIAIAAGVDLKKDWSISCKQKMPLDALDVFESYLALLSKDQMIDLISEWDLSIKYSTSTKRSELMELITDAGRGCPTPKLLLDVKPTRLT